MAAYAPNYYGGSVNVTVDVGRVEYQRIRWYDREAHVQVIPCKNGDHTGVVTEFIAVSKVDLHEEVLVPVVSADSFEVSAVTLTDGAHGDEWEWALRDTGSKAVLERGDIEVRYAP